MTGGFMAPAIRNCAHMLTVSLIACSMIDSPPVNLSFLNSQRRSEAEDVTHSRQLNNIHVQAEFETATRDCSGERWRRRFVDLSPTISIPSIKPRPRTSPIHSKRLCSVSRPRHRHTNRNPR
jgi:hypothetical protein